MEESLSEEVTSWGMLKENTLQDCDLFLIATTLYSPRVVISVPFLDVANDMLRLSEHQKSEHGVEDNLQCTRNFHCPFCSQDDDGRGASFRTNMELISHCEKVHDDKLGKWYISCLSEQ